MVEGEGTRLFSGLLKMLPELGLWLISFKIFFNLLHC
jgi:hypothetical protein